MSKVIARARNYSPRRYASRLYMAAQPPPAAPPAQMPLRQLAVPPPVIVPNGTPLRDPAHPAIVRWEYYPDESKRQNEQGSCMVKLTVVIEGPVQDTVLTISSGCSRLDAACLKAFRSERFLPATQDGKPIVSSIELPINWRLRTR